MRALILYFSGTGNTAYVAHYLHQRLERAGLIVDLARVEATAPMRVAEYELLVLGFPVYLLDAPALVQRTVASLPPVAQRGAFVFATYGGIPGGATRRMLERLAAMGYTPLGAAGVRMPASDGLMLARRGSRLARWLTRGDYARLPAADRLAEHILTAASGLARGEALESHLAPLPPGLHGRLFDRLWARELARGRRLARRYFHVNGACTACGQCARLCPAHNITLVEGRPVWGEDCELCLRCLHLCPTEAIQLGKLTQGKLRWRGPLGNFRP
jgi:ferredoxin